MTDSEVVEVGPIEGRCGARLKQKPGQFCPNYPVSGSKRCRMHGGKSLKGIAHPNWQGGRHPERLVNVLPERMKDAGERASNDPLLGGLRGQMAVMEARLADLIEKSDTEAAGRIWGLLGESLEERERCTFNSADWQHADRRVQQLIRDGMVEQSTWEEIRYTTDLARKLSDSEHRRLERLRAMIPADRVLAAMDSILTAVRDVVDDQEKLDYIARRAAIIMTSNG
jgi:hypothetical protein